MSKKEERLRLLEAQIERLKRRIDILDHRSNRYSWLRVIVFFGGLALSVGGFFIGWWLAAVLAVVTLTAFSIAAYYHGRIDRSLGRHRGWLHIKSTHAARMRLNWQHIPESPPTVPRAGHPFEIDLDVTGPRSIHRLLNTAVSRDGSQRLCDWLLTTTPDPQMIRRRQALIQELTPLTRFRDKLLLKSLFASRRAAEQLEEKRLLNWLDQHTSSRWLGPLLWGSAALNALTMLLLLVWLFAGGPQWWLLSLLCAALLLFVTGDIRGNIFEDAGYLRYAFSALSSVFAYLETYPYGKHHHLKKLCESFFQDRQHSPSTLLKRTGRIASAATLKNNGLLWLIVNALIPWDVYCAYRLKHYKEQIAQRLPTWLDVWFELEALCSLAAFAYLNPEYTLPTVLSDTEEESKMLFRARSLGHPLIPVEQKVTNDFAIDEPGEVVIITGSNMAGKSTFLRTLGVNLCLAYAGAPVNAATLQTTLFRLFTCIRVTDSVTEGYSYFYAEVKRLRQLLTDLDDSAALPLFFLIDEIFKGTNNRERLIGSRAYVRTVVGRNCVGVISTHDLELVHLADLLPQVKNYHFREEVVAGNMVFDYVLRSGPCPTTNALKIMQMEGLPVEEDI